MKKKLKVLLLFDSPYFISRGHDFKKEFEDEDLTWTTEEDVYKALLANGYEVNLLSLYNKIEPLLEEIKENKPDVIFNMAEVFDQKSYLDKNVASLIEMLGIPYTGANTASLLICNDKALTKKMLTFHRVKIPHFYAFYRNRKIWLPKKLKLPLIVKPLCEEASRGISMASVVDNEDAFIERVKYIQENLNMDAIAEEYIDGREFYVSVLGNKRVKVLPLREMKFGEISEDEPRVATYKAKWDQEYREKWGIKNVFAGRLSNGVTEKIEDICKKAYKILNMRCYARFDIRVTPDNIIYIIEANANPCLDSYDEIAQSAEKAGISYNNLIKKIVDYAFQRKI